MTSPGAPFPAAAHLDDEETPLVVTGDMLVTEDRRVDFEAGMSYFPPITLALIVLNIGVFAWQLSVGALDSEHMIVAFGALSRDRVLDGEFWRLASATVLHGSPGHLLGNCAALYVLGIGLEHALGGARTASVYLLAGLAGSLASVMMQPGPSVGASGAVFGMMGAVVTFLIVNRNRYDVRDKRVAGVLAAWAGYTLLTGLMVPFIDNAAHLGGLFAGAAIGALQGPVDQPTAHPTGSSRTTDVASPDRLSKAR